MGDEGSGGGGEEGGRGRGAQRIVVLVRLLVQPIHLGGLRPAEMLLNLDLARTR